MNKIAIRLATAASTAALVVSSFAAPLSATTVEISGNGSDSDNTVEVTQTNVTTVNQSNTANISNNIDVDADTGDNDAEDNTGGDVSINTGDASATVGVSNTANSNQASVSGCCPDDVTLKIKDNGTDYGNNDENKIKFNSTNVNTLTQTNSAYIDNDVDVDLDTGDNDANDNTGGDVSVETGDADATVTVDNQLNANWAAITSSGNGGGVAVEISGNGSDSDNTVEVGLTSVNTINQSNNANVSNDIDVDADTGDNDAEDNTGGSVSIDTGDANATVDVSNMANFNAAELEGCGRVEDLDVLVKDNGDDSDNTATLNLVSVLAATQDNYFDNGKECDEIKVDLDTGGNDVKDNTHGDDPSITTGNADADVEVENTANSNVLGDVDFNLPELPGDSMSVLFLLLAFFS